MMNKKVAGIAVAFSLVFVSLAYASQCVECHTDVTKLKAIAKTIVKPIGSTETAGKG